MTSGPQDEFFTDSENLPLIIGVVAGIVALLCILVIVGAVVACRRRSGHERLEPASDNQVPIMEQRQSMSATMPTTKSEYAVAPVPLTTGEYGPSPAALAPVQYHAPPRSVASFGQQQQYDVAPPLQSTYGEPIDVRSSEYGQFATLQM
jgi:hypothetical protein